MNHITDYLLGLLRKYGPVIIAIPFLIIGMVYALLLVIF
jgi:uncharacterized transporter YbjL